jgi:hypothetical protein
MDPRDYNTGIYIQDLLTSADFLNRPVRERSIPHQLASLQRLTRVVNEAPEKILQELAEAALELCGADTAGVSIEMEGSDGTPVFHWIALTGTYAPFRDARLPVHFMPCMIALQEQRAQQVRVPSAHFKTLMNVDAAPITDGMLLPWNSDGQRATIWVVAHERTHAFDHTDYDIMKIFADFASTAFAATLQHRRNLLTATANGAAAMAHTLAHRINNPLQSVTNSVFLLEEESHSPQTVELASEVGRLSRLVQELLMVYRHGGLIQ